MVGKKTTSVIVGGGGNFVLFNKKKGVNYRNLIDGGAAGLILSAFIIYKLNI
jgi:hypothetical protein